MAIGEKWAEVVRLKFEGRRFDSHALDVQSLAEVALFLRLFGETAKAIWRQRHRERERLPRGFDDLVSLRLRRVENGSVTLPLELPIEPGQMELFSSDVEGAVELIGAILIAAGRDEPFPLSTPKDLLPSFARLGETLGDGEWMLVVNPRGPTEGARIDRATRQRIASRVEGRHEGEVDLVGEVVEVDIRAARFHLQSERHGRPGGLLVAPRGNRHSGSQGPRGDVAADPRPW